ncbi:hypothetical protein BH11BAC4_BH11BAC4_13570 [soil metagenome]
MLKVTGTIVFLMMFFSSHAQKTRFTEAEKAALDSMFMDDEFINMLKSALKPKSYLVVSAGIGNSYFSTKNKQLNASQLDNKLVYTPGLSYLHKSGLGIAATAFLTEFSGQSNFYQYSISPSYSLQKNKKLGLSVSLTHIFTRNGYQGFASPIQNEFYGSIYLKKPWLQPGISLGISGGKYTDYLKIDTVLNGIHRVFSDTARTHIGVFSLNAFVQHEFEFYKLLNKKDGISIKPQLILNAGSQHFTMTYKNPYITRLKTINSVRFKNLGKSTDKSSFSIQSLAFNLDINYVIGKFGFEPQVYLDYYIPETTDKKFTTVFSFVVSYAF